MEVGKTKSVGYQVGVRRTFPARVEHVWQMLMSREGIEIWLGKISSYDISVGTEYHTSSGISGKIRVVNENQNVRLTWKKEHWENASTLQIRTIEQINDKCTISFHQENLPSAEDREDMKAKWEEVLDLLRKVIK
ncbi:SRPBCC family protein [Paenibacillus sp. DYY-L-2]|uniref:SRPBCC family protein n=1 Tax=Paenibacillus sp. DYY-L-2 TaxID=3447013 RepID=UPI003F4FE95D